jgi:SAM-dependent methyltransferase
VNAAASETGKSVFPATSMPDRDWWSALWPDPAAVLGALGIAPGMTVLDLCCGDGYFTAPLAQMVGGRVHALDLDPAMLEQARAEAARQGVEVLGWHCGDALDADRMVPGAVDYVLMANTFHGVPDQPALAATVARLLGPGGRFGIVNWHRRPREETVALGKPRGPRTELRMTPDAVARVVEPAGFALEHETELPPFHYGVVFRKI